MKLARHEKIIELIKEYDIDTQEELAARLNEAGFKVTQPQMKEPGFVSIFSFHVF